MLKAKLKILAKVLVNHLQVVLNHLVKPEQTCSVRGQMIQDNLHLVFMIIDKVDREAVLINLDHFKAFDRVGHHFLEAALSTTGFKSNFHFWRSLLYMTPSVIVKVNGITSKPLILSRCIHQGCPLLPLLYVVSLEPFLFRLRMNSVLDRITLPGATISARFTAYAYDDSTLVASTTKINKVRREIQTYKRITGSMINCDNNWLPIRYCGCEKIWDIRVRIT